MKTKTTKTTKKKQKPLFSARTKYQKIELFKSRGGLVLKLNGSAQVHTKEEGHFHEAFATLPMMLADKVENVLILGGGDGMAARDILRFSGVKKVTLVELDRGVIELCAGHPVFAELNQGALRDPRVNVIIGDGLAWLIDTKQKFDVILYDLEDMETDQPQPLSVQLYRKIYQALHDKLTAGGVYSDLWTPNDSDMMLNAMFAEFSGELPEEKQNAFMKQKDKLGRTKLLMSHLFPHILQWRVDYPVLGTHVSLYMSHTPRTRLRRWPKPKPKHIKPDILKRTVK